jgi:hypothetical protein
MMKLFVWLVAFFCVYFAIRYAGQPLLEAHGFRQTQTALSAFWMVREGWQMAYQTPVVGYPWSIPFEFPIYQALTAFVVSLTGFNLDAVGRLVSFAFLLGCAWPAFGIVRRLGVSKQVAWVFCILLWTSPLYLFWGRTFMIETAAIFFVFSAVPYALDTLTASPSLRSVILCTLFLTLAVLQKITTAGPVVMVLVCIWLVSWWKRGGLRIPGWKDTFVPIFTFGFPTLVAMAWVRYSDIVKAKNPFGEHLTSAWLGTWNFGTIEQKLKFSNYQDVIWDRVFVQNAGGIIGLALIIGAISLTRVGHLRAIFIAGLAMFLLPILIFTNLHIVHDYYSTGCVLFLIGVLAFAVVEWLPTIVPHSGVVFAVTAILVISNLVAFNKEYFSLATKTIDTSNARAIAVGEIIRRETPPGSGIVVFGNDWDSDIAYYSQRKSFTVAPWFKDYERVWTEPSYFLGGTPLKAIVICPSEKGPRAPQVRLRLEASPELWRLIEVQDCQLLIAKELAT